MQTETLINKHDEQIDSVIKSIYELTTKLTVLIKDHSYLSDKVDEVLITVKIFKDSEHKIERIEEKMDGLKEKLRKVQEKSTITETAVQELNSRFTIKKFFTWLKNYWYLWGVLAPALATIADYLYKIDPHG